MEITDGIANVISTQLPNQGLMEMAPNSSPPAMTIDTSVSTQQQHQGLTSMQPSSQVMRTNPPQMPVPSATSSNQFINIQGDNVNDMSTCGIQPTPPQGNISQPMELQTLLTPLEQPPMMQSLESMEVQQNTTHSTPTTTNQPNPPSINNSTPQQQEITNTMSAAQSPKATTDNIPPQVNSSLPTKLICLKEGCTNLAVESTEWDNEYCSSECVVTHCRNVFGAWVSERQAAASEGSIK